MKSNFSLFIIALFISIGAIAQTTITNAGFETWTGSGATVEPTQWNSNRTGGGNAPSGPQTCFQEATNPHGGTYCTRVVSGTTFGIVVNGSLTTGRVEAPSFVKNEGYIRTKADDANFRMPFTGRPDSIVFWYRYTKQGSDYPRVEARLHVGFAYAPEAPVNGNHPDSTVNIIARANTWVGPATTVAAWTRISIPFTYVDARTPQYILITSTSSGDQNGGANGSTMWLDDFEAIYNPTLAIGAVPSATYFVSATASASIAVPFVITGNFNGGNTFNVELSDAAGSFASPTVIATSSATTSGTINATIPAGTPSGAGYRVRIVSSNPVITTANNGNNITVVLVSNSIAPTANQTIAANTNGAMLTLTQTSGATAQEWKFATVSGGPYASFAVPATGTTYTPNFTSAGTYYIVAVSSYPNSINETSNQVQVTVVANSIAPSSSQSILVNVSGTTLTVTEQPTGTAREWKFATVSGGPYVSFGSLQVSTTYTPIFAAAGTYYVVCQSTISGVVATSNQVQISVGNATIATGVVSGSPFLFSPSAPDADVNVAFTTSGTFNAGNVFTAELSDATGSFATATTIGTLTGTTSGTIATTILHTTAAGTAYRVRVKSSNPALFGSDNGTNLVVDQFNSSIAPTASQTIFHGVNGTPITVTTSQAASNNWQFSTTSGVGYVSFTPAEIASTYIPNFATPGIYYVVCTSTNTYGDAVNSSEVQIIVTNGTIITTSAIAGSPFLVSPSLNAPVAVNFTSDAVFSAGNVFTAELSDAAGSFATPTVIGTLTSATIGTINSAIPGATNAGTAYRIRVVSSNPVITGSDNGGNLEVVPFAISIAPVDTQELLISVAGNTLTATTTHAATYQWLFSEVSGSFYTTFSPNQTAISYTPQFNLASIYYIICKATNTATDIVTSGEVVVIVTDALSINDVNSGTIKAYWNSNNFMVNFETFSFTTATVELFNLNGQVVAKQVVNSTTTSINADVPAGTYLFKITCNGKTYTGKTSKQ